MFDTTNTSGGVNIDGEQPNITGDVVGRDQITEVRGDQVLGDKIVQAAPDPLAQYFHQLPRLQATS